MVAIHERHDVGTSPEVFDHQIWLTFEWNMQWTLARVVLSSWWFEKRILSRWIWPIFEWSVHMDMNAREVLCWFLGGFGRGSNLVRFWFETKEYCGSDLKYSLCFVSPSLVVHMKVNSALKHGTCTEETTRTDLSTFCFSKGVTRGVEEVETPQVWYTDFHCVEAARIAVEIWTMSLSVMSLIRW